jgi:ubiquinone/menaquinone biosynthesis C-methylase UbiE
MPEYKESNLNQAPEEEKRFKNLQKLNMINLAASHQEILQDLLSTSVAEEAKKLEEQGEKAEIVEIGTGRGLTTGKILQLCDKAKIISVDNDAGMVAQASENLEQHIKDGKLEIKAQGALEFLKSFPDSSIPLIVSGFTIHNFKNDYRMDVLVEVYRVLKPGGEFITADKIMPGDDETLQKESNWQNAQFDKIYDPIERMKWIDHYDDDMAPDVIMREDELIKTMEEIGFTDIVVSNRHHLDALLIARK